MNAPFRAPARIRHYPAKVLGECPAGMEEALAAHYGRVDWVNDANPADKGCYWIGKGPKSVLWVCDGRDCIAAVEPWRVRRYLYRNIARRREKLLASYLGQGKLSLPEGAMIINYGANIGEVAMAAAAKSCLVTAIEPDPNVLPALYLNARGKPITVVPVAAWCEDGPLPLFLATEQADTSAINHSSEKILALGRRIDTLTEDLRIGQVHLIVGDAEGGDPEVLMGAAETLKRTRYVSVRTALERNGKSARDLCLNVLMGAGFEIIHDEDETLIGRNRNG